MLVPTIFAILAMLSLIFIPNDFEYFVSDIPISRWFLAVFFIIAAAMSFFTQSNKQKKEEQMKRKPRGACKDGMKAATIDQYGEDVIRLTDNNPRPEKLMDDEILIRVKAASINPIDLRISTGYGRVILNKMRRGFNYPAGDGKEFPITLGRDCAGIVEAVGNNVKKFKEGQEIWGAIHVARPNACLAELVVVKEGEISLKPRDITFEQAASIPYVFLTVWSAIEGCISEEDAKGKRVLVLGGTGGIGTFAIQLFKAWGCDVTTTCSSTGASLVEKLGVDDVIDYKLQDLSEALEGKPKFDLILDTIGPTMYSSCFSACKWGGRIVSLVSPVMPLVDDHGLVLGGVKVFWRYIQLSILKRLIFGKRFSWGFFSPNGKALKYVRRLVDDRKVRPVVEKIFNIEDVTKAFDHVAEGHSRGKTVVRF
ncbi:reticulon-4-interacting protein 1 homolog, mitochondrial-like isoform X2 [Anneissia japonica]|nr:reticulon-4-interacting protein 1 homolog, mitochondrial-like isoform X2 [Anneissia japonica]XP_033106442.1 reticulon-4-interacting protein 1 homolog, mitochondrial-like isoform X2 [Anneissia japonica]